MVKRTIPTKLNIYFFIILFSISSVYSCVRERKDNRNVYTINSYPLPVDVDSHAFIEKLRKQHNLRGLREKDANKRLQRLPSNTYFYLPIDSMVDREFVQVIECKATNNRGPEYFEIHKQDDDYFLLVFVTYEIATNISQLDGEEEKILTVFPYKNQEYNHLALIPFHRLHKAYKRKIYLSEDHFMNVMDIAIK